jgi:hypothetical protein
VTAEHRRAHESGLVSRAGLVGVVAAVVALLACSSNPQNVAANTLEAGGNGYATISEAVQAASPGDTILIHAGTYREEVTIDKAVTLDVFGDGDVWVDGQCLRNHGFAVSSSDVSISNVKVTDTIEAGVLLFAEDPDKSRPSDITIDGLTIQDFDCAWTAEQPNSWGQYRAGVAAWYTGSGITVTNNLIQFRTSGSPRGAADGVWFKSNDDHPSGGGHHIAGNAIIGGWDGIGGEEEDSSHGTFDRNSVIEYNTIRDCWDDGIQSEGGDEDVRIRNNDISGCGAGIAFAAPVTGPLYVERNRIHDLSRGLYQNLFCFKVGNAGAGTTHLTENVCDVDTSAEASQGGADGIHQTNEGLSPIVSRRNVFQVSGYVFSVTESHLPSGTSFDEDCVFTTDPGRFVKWSEGEQYADLAELQAVGQERNGRQTKDCSFLGLSTPRPSAALPPPASPPGASPSPAPTDQTPSGQPTTPEPTAGSNDVMPAPLASQTPSQPAGPTGAASNAVPSAETAGAPPALTPAGERAPGGETAAPAQSTSAGTSAALVSPLTVGVGALMGLTVLALAYAGVRWSRKGRRSS